MILSLLFGSVALAQSLAQTPSMLPEVRNFKDVAEFTVTQIGRETSSRNWLTSLHYELSQYGLQILSRYRTRHEECAAQLDQLRSEMASMRTRTVEDLMKRYHDGVGLPAAPAHCIYGRVYFIHPVINLNRIEKGPTAADRAAMIADLNELLQYLPKLQQNLEN